MISSENLANIRVGVLGATGIVCLVYGALALITDQPTPMPFWIPAMAGIASAILITATSLLAGASSATQAFDEGHRRDIQAAQRFGFWIAVAMYPLFGLTQLAEMFAWNVIFAAMGTLTGAAYLLAFVWQDLKGRG